MKINIAHVNVQGQNCLVCEADHQTHTDAGRDQLLAQLVVEARGNGLRVDKAALAFAEHGRIKFYGASDLVGFLANNGLPRWTHTLAV